MTPLKFTSKAPLSCELLAVSGTRKDQVGAKVIKSIDVLRS